MARQIVTTTGGAKRVWVSVTVVWEDDVEPDDVEEALDTAADRAEAAVRGLPS